jgi:hypothetical protein
VHNFPLFGPIFQPSIINNPFFLFIPAGKEVVGSAGNGNKGRIFSETFFPGKGASRMKGAARRRIEYAGHLARELLHIGLVWCL